MRGPARHRGWVKVQQEVRTRVSGRQEVEVEVGGVDKLEEGQGKKRKRGDDVGGLAPKRLLRPWGGRIITQGY